MRTLVVAVLVAVLGAAVLTYRVDRRLERLERDVACLKHPDHATSSIGPVRLEVASRAVPTLVVCP